MKFIFLSILSAALLSSPQNGTIADVPAERQTPLQVSSVEYNTVYIKKIQSFLELRWTPRAYVLRIA